MSGKRFLTIGIVFLLVVSLAVGCGQKDTGGEVEGEDTELGKEQVEISVWLTPQWKGVLDASEEGADYDSFFKEAAKRFSEEYEEYDVKVNVEVVAGDQRDELLNVSLNGGNPPDVFFESIFAMGDYAHRGALVPLNDIVDEDAKKDIVDNYWDSVTFGDDIYFYPFSNNPGTLVYNADMFRDAGLEEYIGEETEIVTWSVEDFEKILNTLKTNTPKDKYPNAYPMGLFALNNQGDTWNLAYLRMFGNEFFDDEGNIILDDENGIKAAKWLKGVYDKGLSNPGAESVSSNDVNAMYQNQQLGVSFTNSILYQNGLADMEEGKAPKFDSRLANVPCETDEAVSFTYVIGTCVFDTGDETRIKVSKDFVKFMSTDSELIKASKNGVPVRTSIANEFKDEMPLFKAYDENSKYLFNFTGNVPGYSELRQVLYPELQALYTGEKTAEEAVKDYQTKGNEVINNAKESSVIYK